jgi:hypothetical protein
VISGWGKIHLTWAMSWAVTHLREREREERRRGAAPSLDGWISIG